VPCLRPGVRTYNHDRRWLFALHLREYVALVLRTQERRSLNHKPLDVLHRYGPADKLVLDQATQPGEVRL